MALRMSQDTKNARHRQATTDDQEQIVSEFDARTEQASAAQYFQFYGYVWYAGFNGIQWCKRFLQVFFVNLSYN